MTTHSAGRTFGFVTAGIGAVTLLASARVARLTASGPGSVPDPRIVGVLGARQLVQGLVTAAVPTSDVLALGAAVDVAHAASLVPVVLFSGRFRRPAAVSTALAVGSALVAARQARDTGRT